MRVTYNGITGVLAVKAMPTSMAVAEAWLVAFLPVWLGISARVHYTGRPLTCLPRETASHRSSSICSPLTSLCRLNPEGGSGKAKVDPTPSEVRPLGGVNGSTKAQLTCCRCRLPSNALPPDAQHPFERPFFPLS